MQRESSYRKLIQHTVRLIAEAERPVRILRNLVWPQSVKQDFLHRKGGQLPDVEYQAFDCKPVLAELAVARDQLASDVPYSQWLLRTIEGIECGARLLSSRGTSEFYSWSERLYGAPSTLVLEQETNALALAQHILSASQQLHAEIELPAGGTRPATSAQKIITRAVKKFFGESAPLVVVDETIPSKAIAGPRRIRLNADARYQQKEIDQLIQHEAFIHVATFLNGREQSSLPILAAGHPGTTRTQEGLAVFAEIMTGTMDSRRFLRLANRVIAIDMAIQGADFIEVWRYFQNEGDPPDVAYDHTQRVFRGGVVTGGAPFTKDVVYLEGLLRVQDFFATAIASGQVNHLPVLFCGKLDIQDIPDMVGLMKIGLCREPIFLPPWVQDLDRLSCFFSFTNFLTGAAMNSVHEYHRALLQRCDDAIVGR